MRIPLIAGNWKMYKTVEETSGFFAAFRPLVQKTEGREIVVCPSFVCLPAAVEAAEGAAIAIGAQDLHYAPEGAFTGEVSAAMLRSAGASWVIIGHSERRQYFHETDEVVLRKAVAALEAGLRPIICVGELLQDREAGRTEEVCRTQFRGGLGVLTRQQFEQIVIAYEPVWAIGTGRTATPEIAQAAHAFLREQVRECHGAEAAAAMRILYGGSVKPDNIKGLMAQEDIDGALVGGASLDAASFAAIVNF